VREIKDSIKVLLAGVVEIVIIGHGSARVTAQEGEWQRKMAQALIAMRK